jgi:hypothetical protein
VSRGCPPLRLGSHNRIADVEAHKVLNFVMDRDVLEAKLDEGLGLVCILSRVQYVG